MTHPDPASRAGRRLRTRQTILEAARQLFAEQGFERTTIRAVAARAGIDPALVMQHYGSKEGLFAAAAQWSEEDQRVLQAPLAQVSESVLADLFLHFDDEAEREAMTTLMRNCLTHPTATAVMRDEVMAERGASLSGKLVAAGQHPDEAALRAGLFASCMMGLAMSRYMIEVEPVASAAPADIERVLLPALRALLEPPDAGPTAYAPPA